MLKILAWILFGILCVIALFVVISILCALYLVLRDF